MNSLHFSVNWRAGSLRRYESLSSIGAKFCYVNRIPPTEFLNFLAGFLATGPSSEGSEACFNPSALAKELSRFKEKRLPPIFTLLESPCFRLQAFAKALGESVETLRTSFFAPLIPGHEVSPEDTLHAIRYCPECLAQGYHATFHQLPWFVRCLIHGADLCEAKAIPNTTHLSQGGRRLPRGDGRLAGCMYGLLFDESSLWKLRSSNSWLDANDGLQFANVTAYVKWIRLLTQAGIFSPRSELIFRDFADDALSSGQRISDQLQCANELFPGPPAVLSALSPTQVVGASRRCSYPVPKTSKSAVREVLRVCTPFFLKSAIDIRIINRELFNEKTSWSAIADQNVQAMVRKRAARLGDRAVLREGISVPRDGHAGGREMACNRTALALQFEHKWKHRISDAMSSHGTALRLIGEVQLIMYAILKQISAVRAIHVEFECPDPFQHVRKYDISTWELEAPLKEVCDALLDALVLADSWTLYRREAPGETHLIPQQVAWDARPIAMLRLEGKSTLRLRIWLRSKTSIPDWAGLDAE